LRHQGKETQNKKIKPLGGGQPENWEMGNLEAITAFCESGFGVTCRGGGFNEKKKLMEDTRKETPTVEELRRKKMQLEGWGKGVQRGETTSEKGALFTPKRGGQSRFRNGRNLWYRKVGDEWIEVKR